MVLPKLSSVLFIVALLASSCSGGGDASGEATDDVTGDEPSDLSVAREVDGTDDQSSDSETGGPTGVATDEGSDSDVGGPDTESSASAVDDDRPCDGGAFPGDDDFRELLCAVQWAQVDVFSAGGEIDPEWTTRTAEAILTYADDRDAAVAELEAILAELTEVATGADSGGDPPAPGVPGTGLRDCMVEVAELIIEANVAAGFDPTTVDAWQQQVDEVEAHVDSGDLAAAEALVCELRDEIAAAIADPSSIPD